MSLLATIGWGVVLAVVGYFVIKLTFKWIMNKLDEYFTKKDIDGTVIADIDALVDKCPNKKSYEVLKKARERGFTHVMGTTSGGKMTRIHCPFVSDSEVEKITQCLKEQGEPHYVTEILEDEDEMMSDGFSDGGGDGEDPMYKEALNLILSEGKASTSFIQRHLKIGYNRAARIIDQMEKAGIVSSANHVGKREIIGR